MQTIIITFGVEKNVVKNSLFCGYRIMFGKIMLDYIM